MFRNDLPDPVWQWKTGFGVRDEQCSQHWLEAVIGIDAKVWGPLHLGLSVDCSIMTVTLAKPGMCLAMESGVTLVSVERLM